MPRPLATCLALSLFAALGQPLRAADPDRALALRTAARTASAIWYAAGDKSADFSWYTRRASLGAIYGATLAYWLRDDDPDTADAMAFFDRRLADLARLQRPPAGGPSRPRGAGLQP